MKNFILLNDFRAIATEEDLSVLSNDNSKIISQCNAIAIDEAAGYLSTKYDVAELFKDPVEYVEGEQYKLGDRIYAVELAGNPLVPTGNLMHFTCIKDTVGTPAPDILNTEYFEEIDSRNQKLLEVVMSMSLFYIHKRLSPNNIPLFRVISYDGNGSTDVMSAIKWLTMIQEGKLFPYGWALISENPEVIDPEVPIDFDKLGNDPALGMMWGNDLCPDYIWYNNLNDPNIIRK